MLTRLIPSAGAHFLPSFSRIILGLAFLSCFAVMLFMDMSACALVTFRVISQHLETQLSFRIDQSDQNSSKNAKRPNKPCKSSFVVRCS